MHHQTVIHNDGGATTYRWNAPDIKSMEESIWFTAHDAQNQLTTSDARQICRDVRGLHQLKTREPTMRIRERLRAAWRGLIEPDCVEQLTPEESAQELAEIRKTIRRQVINELLAGKNDKPAITKEIK